MSKNRAGELSVRNHEWGKERKREEQERNLTKSADREAIEEQLDE